MFCNESILNALQESYFALVRFLLPEGILDYFELSKVVEGLTGLHIYLEEKNRISPKTWGAVEKVVVLR